MTSVLPQKSREMTSGSSRRVSAIMVCWFLSNASPNALSLTRESAEYPLKLAFLYNFAKFVEWPTDAFRSPDAPLAICIVGHNPFSLDNENELRARPAGGHPVEFEALKTTDALNLCHIVFIPVTEKDQAVRIVKSLKGSVALTVGESEGFAARGGLLTSRSKEGKSVLKLTGLQQTAPA
jgi:hypothetical protein